MPNVKVQMKSKAQMTKRGEKYFDIGGILHDLIPL
jgi:hypothetical protein